MLLCTVLFACMQANADAVLRPIFAEGFFHPHEALMHPDMESSLVYAFGCTLNTRSPAVAVVSTGDVCYPFNRPVGASNGRLLVLGSYHMFTDKYISRVDNKAFAQSVVKFLADPVESKFCPVTNISDYKYISNTLAMGSRPFACFRAFIEPLPADVTDLMDLTLFDGNKKFFDEVKHAHELLGVAFEPLESIVRPSFVVPKLKPIPAVYPPSFWPLLKSPEIPLVDLDDLMAPPEVRLNRLANTFEDIEQFVTQAGTVLGIPGQSASEIIRNMTKELFSN